MDRAKIVRGSRMPNMINPSDSYVFSGKKNKRAGAPEKKRNKQ